MKRSMSQMMCDQCSEPFQKGWQMFHHKKTCKGKRQRTQCAQSTASLHDTDDVSFEGLVHDQETTHEPVAVAALNAPVAEPTIDSEGFTPWWQSQPLNAPVAEPTIGKLKRVSLSPRTKEIVTFLATAERGEGCSRENAQCWLDYQHAQGGQNAKLLPKDIRTLWSHVDAVLYVMICYMFACTI